MGLCNDVLGTNPKQTYKRNHIGNTENQHTLPTFGNDIGEEKHRHPYARNGPHAKLW